MLTFSLMPRRSSVLPQMAAPVSTVVISWNEDGLMNDSVESNGHRSGRTWTGLDSRRHRLSYWTNGDRPRVGSVIASSGIERELVHEAEPIEA
ncbi:MAG TPA: hypothetical protein VI072_22655 [Polyangiaceae bacterium]